MYPNVGAAGCGLVGAGGVLGIHWYAYYFARHVNKLVEKGGSYDVTVLKGDDYVTRVNLYMSRFSDGVLISYSTVYK